MHSKLLATTFIVLMPRIASRAILALKLPVNILCVATLITCSSIAAGYYLNLLSQNWGVLYSVIPSELRKTFAYDQEREMRKYMQLSELG